MNKVIVDLTTWTVIRISGPDKKEYLNGIITYDLDKLIEHKICQSMFLTPKAKIRSIFWLLDFNDEYILYAPPAMRTPLIEDLLKYKLNMQVKLEDITEDTPNLHLLQVEKPDSFSITIAGHYFNFEQSDTADNYTMSYREFTKWLLINRGIPIELLSNENPFEVGLSDAVTLEKGCFLGQEPLSRMYHRGKPRKVLYQVISDTPLDKELFIDNEIVGNLISQTDKNNQIYSLVSVKSGLNVDGSLKFDNFKFNSIVKVGSYPKISR
jgi:folate-binding protein YgfZ